MTGLVYKAVSNEEVVLMGGIEALCPLDEFGNALVAVSNTATPSPSPNRNVAPPIKQQSQAPQRRVISIPLASWCGPIKKDELKVTSYVPSTAVIAKYAVIAALIPVLVSLPVLVLRKRNQCYLWAKKPVIDDGRLIIPSKSRVLECFPVRSAFPGVQKRVFTPASTSSYPKVVSILVGRKPSPPFLYRRTPTKQIAFNLTLPQKWNQTRWSVEQKARHLAEGSLQPAVDNEIKQPHKPRGLYIRAARYQEPDHLRV